MCSVACCSIYIVPILLYFPAAIPSSLTLLHSERPKLYAILAFLSAIGLTAAIIISQGN